MPIVTIDWFGGRSPEQMEAISRAVTDALVEHGKVAAKDVWIRYSDTPKDNWYFGEVAQE